MGFYPRCRLQWLGEDAGTLTSFGEQFNGLEDNIIALFEYFGTQMTAALLANER
jgi:hypothetical protein